jgi:prepilin-type N-terminal cleavage/methylation domain-containing protein
MMLPVRKLRTVSRQGFTIVELLVALALVLFIMSIISQVFVDSSEAFRNQRAKAELSEKLRFITQTLRSDLQSNHFEYGRKLSDGDFWRDGPPKVGYFRLEQRGFNMAKDPATNLPVTSLTGEQIANNGGAEGHVLAFTSFLKGKNPGDFHSISLPANQFFTAFRNWKGTNLSPGDSRFEENADTYQSPDAEVAWFLGPSTDFSEYMLQDEVGVPTVRLFKLYRRIWLMLPEDLSQGVNTAGLDASGLGDRISVVPPGMTPAVQMNAEGSLQAPNNDVPMRRGIGNVSINPGDVNGWRAPNFSQAVASSVNALIADNVISFSVEVFHEGANQFVPLHVALGSPLSPSIPAVYDTWCSRSMDAAKGIPVDFTQWNVPGQPGAIPMVRPNAFPVKLSAIRVTIRLYDTNNVLSPSKTTWQATLIEPL